MTTWKPVFSDNFPAAADVDRSRWESPHWTQNNNKANLGRTGFRNPTDFTGPFRQLGLIPCTSENGADLRFSTYNPKAEPAMSAFLGSELHTIDNWGGHGQTVKFEAVVKCPAMPGGAVTSLFAYNLTGFADDRRNEIDFEFGSNHWTAPKQLYTNVFVNSNGAGLGPGVKPTAVNFQQWNTFSLIYTPSQSVEWQLNGNSFLKETQNVPDARLSDGMRLYLNFWAPEPGWDWAYNGNLQPSRAPGQEWHYYVKKATVYYGT
jgi:hypothetical protein